MFIMMNNVDGYHKNSKNELNFSIINLILLISFLNFIFYSDADIN